MEVKEVVQPEYRLSPNIERHVKEIQAAARDTTLPNAVKKELTEAQAVSVFLRARQLYKESGYHAYTISPEEKRAQVEECYRIRKREIENS